MSLMLEGFYEILSFEQNGAAASWHIRFDAGHGIYRVHFPGTPITPGACQLEIFRQLACRYTGEAMAIASVKNLKYLQIIDPLQTPEVTVSANFEKNASDGEWKASVLVTCDGNTYTKATLLLKAE